MALLLVPAPLSHPTQQGSGSQQSCLVVYPISPVLCSRPYGILWRLDVVALTLPSQSQLWGVCVSGNSHCSLTCCDVCVLQSRSVP